jgi:hypothetical protein
MIAIGMVTLPPSRNWPARLAPPVRRPEASVGPAGLPPPTCLMLTPGILLMTSMTPVDEAAAVPTIPSQAVGERAADRLPDGGGGGA